MTLIKPTYFDYIVWDYSDKWHPVMKGFRKDTPKEYIEQWKKDCKALKKMKEEGYDY